LFDDFFPNSAGTVGPVSGAGALFDWTRGDANNFVAGDYRIELTFTQQDVVPEPSSLASMTVLFGLAALRFRRQRRAG
jgi:hypothetical protein